MIANIGTLTEEENDWMRDQCGYVVSIDDPEYPRYLRLIENPPPYLFVMGNLECLQTDLISVVGSREPAPESVEWMERFVPELIKLGITIVSGGARGIDQRAHSLALRNKSRTVVVLPSGLRSMYPKDLEFWKPLVLDHGGCFVSELPPFTPMRSHYFHQRNRIVSGLSKTLLLVEAKRKSGSSMTGRLGVQQGRTLCVVPGSPTRLNWGGCLDLLSDGAFSVRDAVDVWLLHSNSRLG